MKIALCFVLATTFSLELMAQGKLYVEPYIGFFVGHSKEDKNINQNQNIINHYYFGGKDLSFGGKASYKKNKHKVSIGYETSYYASNYKRLETGVPRIDFRHSSSIGPINSLYAEYARETINLNIALPSFLQNRKSEEKLYLVNSKISPLFGIEYRFLGKQGQNNRFYFQNSGIWTSQGNYMADTQYLQLNASANISMRGGVVLDFYSREKQMFNIMLLYKFAFKDVGYIRYRFISTNANPLPSFNYQNITRGNGFLIAMGVPIKVLVIKRK